MRLRALRRLDRLARSARERRLLRPRRGPLGILSLGILLALLSGCSIGTPGLPRVWPGQSISPNVQTEPGAIIELTIRATNDSRNADYGNASQVRAFTALPAGVELVDFTASDRAKPDPHEQIQTWVEKIDTENRVVTVSFNGVGAGEIKTATLRLRVSAPVGTGLTFRTMMAWSNAAPDQIACDIECATQGLLTMTADDPQLRAYVEENPAEIQALLETYQGGGKGIANTVQITVGDAPINAAFPTVALLANSSALTGTTLSTKAAFTPDEPVMLWYNRPGAEPTFLFRTDALSDGSIVCGMSAEAWDEIPADATSIVAHGQFSTVEAVYLFNR